MSSNPITNKEEIVYLLVTKQEDMFKIGKTKGFNTTRINSLSKEWEFNLEKSYIAITETGLGLEKTLHYLFRNHNIKGLVGDGATEFFDINCFEEVLKTIKTFKDSKFDNIEVKKIQDINLKISKKNIDGSLKLEKNKSKSILKEESDKQYKTMITKNELIKHKKFIFLKNKMNLNQRKLYNFFIDKINDYYKELGGNISLIDWGNQFEYSLESLKKITESTNYTVLIKSLNFFKRTIFESKIIDIEKKNTIEENMVLIKETIIDRKKNRVFVKFGNDALKVPFEEKGFIKIDIDTMISLRGKHTLTIYEILKSYDYGKRNVPVISLYDLKELLGMNEDYRNNLIKPQIIIPAIKEIEKYTPLRIKYKMLKNGREISHIKFSFFNNNDKFIFQSNK